MERRWIWPFELLDKLGEGGMGIVYRARYVKNDRQVAVKLLPTSITDETLLARFEREMQLLKTLRHPNIIHTFGGKCEGDQRFYAMELIEGGTIDDLIRDRGRLSIDATVAYAVEMCAALAYAHEKGIVHRDVKPGNFLIAKDGTIKLGDFGLATFAAASKLTQTGKTMGTFRYMAPEQIRGKPDPCPQTDLYSLGIVLYEMLTGKVPFDADTPAEVLHQHLKTPAPRVSETIPTVPKPLDDLIDRLLQKRIEDRPASAVEVGLALKNIDEVVHVATRRTVEVAGRPTESERPAFKGSLLTDADGYTIRGGLPWWAAAAPGAVALLALLWAWSRGDEVAALERVESHSVQKLRTGGSQEKVAAAQTLGKIGDAGDESLDALGAALSDADPQVRAAAATALGEVGPDAGESAGRLFGMMKADEDPNVRLAATAAHAKITGETQPGE